MSRLLIRPALFLYAILVVSVVPTLAQSSQPSNAPMQCLACPTDSSSPLTFQIFPWMDPNLEEITIDVNATPPHLAYFGGPVVSNVHVVQVLYGNGSYAPGVTATTTPSIASFFRDITNSGFMDMLSEYNTPISGGTGQIIGHGTFDGQFTIIPSAADNGSTIDDSQIQSELLAQINAGHLPAPILDASGNVNTIYMIYFPPNKTITLHNSTSCAPGGFCAYHGTTSDTFNLKNILYGVFPDMQSDSSCFNACGSSDVFGNYTSVTSHELAEAVTDPDVGLVPFLPARSPLAWYDEPNNQEIGDLCNGQQGSYTTNGATYIIQYEFSNAASNCILPSTPDFSLSASPTSLTLSRGGSGSSTITVIRTNGFPGSVSLATSSLPAGVTASFGSSPTTSNSSVTFTASSTATTGTSTITITGTSGTLSHTTSISLTINAPPDFSLAASPGSLTVAQGSNGSSTITVTPSGGFTGSVTLSTSALPSGVTASFGTNPATSTSVLLLTASSTAALGTSTVTITGTSGSFTRTAALTLTINGPVATLTPSSLTFGGQNVGTTSSAQILTLTNSGTAPLSITGGNIGVSGDFGQTNNCGTSLVAGASCIISVTFTPTATGTRTGTVTIPDNAAGSPHTASLSGTGITPAVTLSPTSVAFPDQKVGTTGAIKTVTLNNGGTGTLTISAITVTGDYAQTNNCASSLPVNTSCIINVTFRPTAAGLRSGTLSVTDNAPGSPHTATLSGTGVVPCARLSPGNISFGGQKLGTTSMGQSITLTNCGSVALSINQITASVDFGQTNNCGSSLSPGASCNIDATFTPTAPGLRTGTITVSDDAPNSPQSASLSGTVFQGYHDIANCQGMVGWAWDSAYPNTPITVYLFEGSRYLGSAYANEYRPDLAGSYGNGYHGFTWTNVVSLLDGATHSVSVHFTQDANSPALNNSPKTISCNPSVNIAWIQPSALSWGPANTLTAAGFAYGGAGNVALQWRDITLNGPNAPWIVVPYEAPTDPANGSWSNTIPSADTCHVFQAKVQYSGLSATRDYDGVVQGYCSLHVLWIQPQSTAGFGPPGSLVVAGLAQGGPSGAQVTLWVSDDTAHSGWSPLSFAPIPDATGIWYNSIPNVNYTHEYSVYITYNDRNSGGCSYFGNGAATNCP